MARKIRAKLIMELRDQGMSRRSIAKTRHMSMGSVCEVFDIADDRGITWDQVKGMGDERVYELFYPDRNAREGVFEEPDWSYVHAEMAKVGVNLRLLHDEYKSKCSREHMVLASIYFSPFSPTYFRQSRQRGCAGFANADAPLSASRLPPPSRPHRRWIRPSGGTTVPLS